MAAIVYILCALTSFLCFWLLIRSWFSNRSRLLFWCSWGFAGLFLNNVILFIDAKVFISVSMFNYRALPALFGMLVMIYGLITEEV